MKRNEKRKSIPYKSELDGGRYAGHGIVEGDYSEDSGGKNYELRYKNKPWRTGTTKEEMEPSEVRIIQKARKDRNAE